MKTFKLLSAFVVALTFVGCNDDDNNGSQTDPLAGEWRLTHLMGGIAGNNVSFEPGTISWDFDPESGTVTVVNTNTNEQLEDLFESGTYEFSFEENTATPASCEEVLVIDDVSLGCWNASSSTLTLTQIENDGFVVTLKR